MKFNFQTIILIIFGVFVLIGVAAFSGFVPLGGKSSNTNPLTGSVTIWGTVDGRIMKTYFDALQNENSELTISYVQKTDTQLNNELADALASGTGPDLFFLADEYIVRHKDKVLAIPYDTYSQRAFQENFINQSALYLTAEGILGLPFTIDPMVLYYNRDLFASAFIVNPPTTWRELLEIAPQLTQQTDSGRITQSAVTLGTYDNIPHAKDIVSMIAMQGGSPIVTLTGTGQYQESLTSQTQYGGMISALRYYTSFAQPTQPHYSWNANLRSARDAFIAEETALYIGYASELQTIRLQNPNLNFDVTIVPQIEEQNLKMTGARMYALAITKQSQNVAAAYQLAGILTSPSYINEFVSALQLPPVSRQVLAVQPQDTYMQTFYNSALISRGWWDPDPQQTELIFKNMIQETLAGVDSVARAVRRAESDIAQLLR